VTSSYGCDRVAGARLEDGFEGQEIKGVVFEDVPPALEKWHASGIKVLVPLYMVL
jgi:methionine salvage enolase-phosphatase E1